MRAARWAENWAGMWGKPKAVSRVECWVEKMADRMDNLMADLKAVNWEQRRVVLTDCLWAAH